MTRLRFDANLKWLFTELPFERRFDAAAAAGFAAVEYASPYEHPASRLVALLRGAGLHQVLINTPMGAPGTPERAGIACFPDQVPQFRDGVISALEHAVELQCDFVHVVGGIRPEGVSRESAIARYVANISWAAEQARGTGVRLLLEMQNQVDAPGFVLESSQHASQVADEIGDPAVGLLLDVYHVQRQGENLLDTVAAVWPTVLHIQVADPPARTEPGTGEIAWPAVFGLLRERRYEGWIGCEYRPSTSTEAGLGWLKELAG
jgi:hydroxypyruvate isomerase